MVRSSVAREDRGSARGVDVASYSTGQSRHRDTEGEIYKTLRPIDGVGSAGKEIVQRIIRHGEGMVNGGEGNRLTYLVARELTPISYMYTGIMGWQTCM